MKTFSIIVPCFNLAPWIRSCLDSVAAQSFADWECIVVDDGSTDGSAEILDEYVEKLKKLDEGERWDFKILHQANAGEGAARNAGLAVAQGEWVLFLDGDDMLAPGALARVAKIIAAYPDENLIRFGYEKFEDGREPVAHRECALSREVNSNCRVIDISRQIAERDYFVYVCQFASRRLMIGDERFGNYRRGADRVFVLQVLCSRVSSFVATDVICYFYRQRQGSAMNCQPSVRVLKDELSHRLDVIDVMDNCEKEIHYRHSGWLEEYCVRLYHQFVWEKRGKDFAYDVAARRELIAWYRHELPRIRRARDFSRSSRLARFLYGCVPECLIRQCVSFNYPLALERLAVILCDPARVFRSFRIRLFLTSRP